MSEGKKSVRVELPDELYDRVKEQCPEHGQLSQLIRRLLEKHLNQVEQA